MSPGGICVTTDINAADVIFDPVYLSDVAASLSLDRLTALLNSYFGHTNEQLARIDALLAEGNLVPITAEAHALVGSAGNFGAVCVSALARKLEQASKQSQLDVVTILATDLRRASDLASMAMSDWLKGQLDAV